MNGNRITIGAATALLLVVLRVAIGWHFFYEGYWKSQHQTEFETVTEIYLSSARGPLADYFYRLVPDINGRRHLLTDLVPEVGTMPDGKTGPVRPLVQSWEAMRQKFLEFYKPPANSKYEDLYKKLEAASKQVFDRKVYGKSGKETGKGEEASGKDLEAYLKDLQPQIDKHFEALKRYEDRGAVEPATAFEIQRRWDEMQELRKEAKGWVADLAARESAYKHDLMDLVVKPSAEMEVSAKEAWAAREADRKKALAKADTEEAKKKIADEAAKDPAPKPAEDLSPLAEGKNGPSAASPFGPIVWNRLQWLSFGLMCTMLTAGAGLMLGLFTRLSALAAAGFLVTIVLAQPSYPGVYPADVPQLGHSLFVTKDGIELIALLVLATTNVGRWGGLDYFVHRIFVKPFFSKDEDD